jgi:TRAP-type C4-dicarboxylate transport system permease small subunit
MNYRKGPIFLFGIIAIILGWTLYKQFDFQKLKFEKPALAVVYISTFIVSVFMLLRNLRSK